MTPMIDPKRQEFISDPSTIFQKQRNKSQMMNKGRQEGERQRESLRPRVPLVGDDDIIELCKKYPKQANEEELKSRMKSDEKPRGAQLQMFKLQEDARQKQFELIKNIERSLKKYQKEKFQFNFE